MPQETSGENRQPIFDYIRVFSCIGIIGLHVVGDWYNVPGAFRQAFFRLWLPMFFILSGLLFLTREKEEPIGKFYLKRFEKIIIPFAIYGLIYSCWFHQGHRILEWPTIDALRHAKNILGAAVKENLKHGVYFHLWFVYEMIGLYVIMPFLRKALQAMSDQMLKILMAVILIFQSATIYLPLIGIEFGVSNHFNNWVIYLVLGYVLMQEFAKRQYPKIAIIGGIVFVAAALWKGLAGDTISDNFYDLAPHMILQVAGLFAILMMLEKPLTKFEKLNKFMAWFSGYTFEIYLIHGYIMWWYTSTYGNDNGTLLGTLWLVLKMFVISTAFALIFSNVITKNVQRLFRLLCRLIGNCCQKIRRKS